MLDTVFIRSFSFRALVVIVIDGRIQPSTVAHEQNRLLHIRQAHVSKFRVRTKKFFMGGLAVHAIFRTGPEDLLQRRLDVLVPPGGDSLARPSMRGHARTSEGGCLHLDTAAVNGTPRVLEVN